MKEIRLKSGHEVADIEVDGVSTLDYPDFSDAYICYASVLKDGTWWEANDQELDELNNDTDLVYEAVLDYLF